MDNKSIPMGSIENIPSIGKQHVEMEPKGTPVGSIMPQQEMDSKSPQVGSIEDINSIGKQHQETDPEKGSTKDINPIGNQNQEIESEIPPVASNEDIIPIGIENQDMVPESTPVGSTDEINPIGNQQQETDPESTPEGSKNDANYIGKLQTQEEDCDSTPIGSIEDINPVGKQLQQDMDNMISSHTVLPPRRPQLAPVIEAQRPQILPRRDLLIGSRDDYINFCIPLYHASMKGDWETANVILCIQPELVQFSITENDETPLHVAAMAKSTELTEKFVENLVKMMAKEDLELRNKNGNTPLCLAVSNGNVKIVKTLVSKNRALLDIPGGRGMLPLYMASLFGHREMIHYLYDQSEKMSADCWNPQNRSWVLQKCVQTDIFDVALKIVTDRPELAVSGSFLGCLARKKDAFRGIKPKIIWRVINQILAVIDVKVGPSETPSDAMVLLRIIWSAMVKRPKKEIDDILRGPPDPIGLPPGGDNRVRGKHSSRIAFIAAEMGNTEFLVELFRLYPDLIWKVNDNNQTVFHVAVSHRHEGIYSLLYDMGSMTDMITPLKDEEDNNMLHLVGKTAMIQKIQDVSGIAQMQRELLWFKEVEALLPPTFRERKNKEGLTPHELFTREHKELMSSNERWMKDTANQCLVVATLIASIGFAAAFSVPGGYDQNNGIPLFVKKVIFIIFTISDAMSVAFSSISILTLLSIFTSRYSELDFLASLPNKLMRGIATLFLSLSCMLVGFSFSFFLLFKEELIWVPVLICLFTSIPVILYIRRQYELLMDVYQSTHGNLFKPKNILFSNKIQGSSPPRCDSKCVICIS